MTARTPEFRGRIVEDGWLAKNTRQELRDLADQFPVGSRVVHECGRQGTVALDQPVHVPGVFDGGPTAVCLSRGRLEPMVFVSWDNDEGLTWRVWAPVAKIRRSAAPAVNRPGNKARVARIGGRR
ncbi:hypothetical protein ACIP4X_17650 [Streptomyces sp. NPDC088817]|uniref:hypothetical protein n=1 Tax=Streptomyces sp. NPDC088817 TaxID=3365907 RepID=UPI0037F35C85